MTFDEIKHKANLRGARQLLRMVDNTGAEIVGVGGLAGVAEVINEAGDEIGADKIVCEPGRGFEPHTHPGHHLLYVLRGRGYLQIDGKNYEMVRGDLFYVPANYPHAMTAARRHRLVVLAIGFPHRKIDSAERMTLVGKEEKK